MDEVETGKVGMLWGWGVRFRGFGSRTMVEKEYKNVLSADSLEGNRLSFPGQ